ncbi:MAG: hypothetical protein U0R64_04295 [Candidatus Nanopelagicales bacterium]
MSEQDESAIDIVEEVSEAITEDGDVVSEDVIAAIDEETGDAIVDDLVTVESPDGSVASEEVVTAISGEDGTAEIISDTVATMDADGNIEVAELVSDEE